MKMLDAAHTHPWKPFSDIPAGPFGQLAQYQKIEFSEPYPTLFLDDCSSTTSKCDEQCIVRVCERSVDRARCIQQGADREEGRTTTSAAMRL